MPPPTIATRARCSPLTPPGRAPSRHPVEREVEGVEVPDARAGVEPGAAIEHDRHALLGEPAVRAQRRIEAREVVARGRGADDGVTRADHDHVADPVLGQLEPPAGLRAIEHRLHPRQAVETLASVLYPGLRRRGPVWGPAVAARIPIGAV